MIYIYFFSKNDFPKVFQSWQEAEDFSHLVSGESGSLQENIPHGPFQHEIQQRQLPVTSVYFILYTL